MPFVHRDGLRIHYLDVGAGPAVLLLHGFPLSGEAFRPQLDALAAQYRFLVPDHRGFGQSDSDHRVSEMSVLAADAFAVLDDADVSTAVVGGVSMGGYVAMAMLREDPSRVKALVLADTHPFADDEAGKVKREQLARDVLDKGMTVLVDEMLPKLLSADAPAPVKGEVKRIILENPPQGAASAARGMALRADSREILSRYGGPSLVVIGEKDAITPLERAQATANLIKGAKLAKIPGAGHLANQEAPEAFNRELSAFLTSLR